MSQYSMERRCPDNSKKYRLISVSGLWAEQFAIEIDQFYEKLWKFQKSQFSRKFQNLRFNTSISIANCSAHRSPTEMSLYFLELSGQHLSIEYWLISVRGLWAEQFAIEIDQFYEKLCKFQKSQFSRKCQNLRFNTSISIANCSAHR